MPTTFVTIPCFNERERFDASQLHVLLGNPSVRLVLVDDGSTDGTGAMLREAAEAHPGRVEALSLPENRGKAEAVRAGLLHGLASGAQVVGYLDADFSTPPGELLRLLATMDERRADVVMGSRVRLLGRAIERRAARHYLGRIFATAASLTLGLPVYDTQCGAKLLRRTPALEAALREPFTSAWAFDVELLSRLLKPHGGVPGQSPESIVEVPLQRWSDVAGSKLSPKHMVRAGGDLARLAAGRYLRRR